MLEVKVKVTDGCGEVILVNAGVSNPSSSLLEKVMKENLVKTSKSGYLENVH